jgi:trans-aconitate methyltransferase
LGCGPGQVSHYLLNKRPDLKLLGIDLAPNMIRLPKQLNPGVDCRMMDVRQVRTLQQSFDAVFAGFCLPYLPLTDVRQLLQNLSDMLHSGGLLYLSLATGSDDNLIRSTSPNAEGLFICIIILCQPFSNSCRHLVSVCLKPPP